MREKTKPVAKIDQKKEGAENWLVNLGLYVIFLFGFPWTILAILQFGFLIEETDFVDKYKEKSIRCTYLSGFKTRTYVHLKINEPMCPLFVDFKGTRF